MRENEFNLFTYENWRDVARYEGLYQVSSWGRVRSLDRWIWNVPNQAYSLRKGKILKPRLNIWGYQQVQLSKDGKKKHYQVHRLVAQAFIPNPLQLSQVNHINECKDDNSACNLEWCNCRYNINFGSRTERASKALKGKPNIALSKRVAQIDANTNEIIRIWDSTAECQRNGYDGSHISNCCLGKRKTHHGYKWQYVD